MGINREISPALVISVIALFVALGGGAYAALGPGSVGSKQLKQGAVTTKALRDGAVAQSKIRDGAIGSSQIRNGSVGPKKLTGGIPGTLVAYALVTPDGVVASQSKGIDDSNVAQLPLAQYCFSDLPAHSMASVTPASNGESAVVANLEMPPAANSSCELLDSTKSYLAVTTLTGINALEMNWSFEPFYIYLYR